MDSRAGVSDREVANAFRKYRRPASRTGSTTSAGSATSASSRQSGTSGLSSGSHKTPENKTNSRVRKTYQGRKDKSGAANDIRPFCCTFCCDKFKSKYNWMRHEKSLHLNLENWVCAPFGGAVLLPSTGRVNCTYCNQLDPTAEHLTQQPRGM